VAYIKVDHLDAKLRTFKAQSLSVGCFMLVEWSVEEESKGHACHAMLADSIGANDRLFHHEKMELVNAIVPVFR
jgi:hypothetical protein